METNTNEKEATLEKPLTLKEWMITLLVLSIPIIGLIMVFIWAFGEKNSSKKTYCQALILYVVIFSAIGTILAFTIGASLFASLSSINAQNQQLTQEVQKNMELSEKIIDAGLNQDASIVNDYLKEQNSNINVPNNNKFLIDLSKLIDGERTLLREELLELKGNPNQVIDWEDDYLPGPISTYNYENQTYDVMDNHVVRVDYTRDFKFPWNSGQSLNEFLLLFNLEPSRHTEAYETVLDSEGNLVKITYPSVINSDFTLQLIVIEYANIEKTVVSNIYFNFYKLV